MFTTPDAAHHRTLPTSATSRPSTPPRTALGGPRRAFSPERLRHHLVAAMTSLTLLSAPMGLGQLTPTGPDRAPEATAPTTTHHTDLGAVGTDDTASATTDRGAPRVRLVAEHTALPAPATRGTTRAAAADLTTDTMSDGASGGVSGQWCQLPDPNSGDNGDGWDGRDDGDWGHGRHSSWQHDGDSSQPRTWRLRVGPVDLKVAVVCRPDSEHGRAGGRGRWECHAPASRSDYNYDFTGPSGYDGYGGGNRPGYGYPGPGAGGQSVGWDRYGWNPYASDFGWLSYAPRGGYGPTPYGYGPNSYAPEAGGLDGYPATGFGPSGPASWNGGARMDWVLASSYGDSSSFGDTDAPGGCWLVRPRQDHSSLSLFPFGQ